MDPEPSRTNIYSSVSFNHITRALTYTKATLDENYSVLSCDIECAILKRELNNELNKNIDNFNQNDLFYLWKNQKETCLTYAYSYYDNKQEFSVRKNNNKFLARDLDCHFSNIVLKQTNPEFMDANDKVINYLLNKTDENKLDENIFENEFVRTPKIIEFKPNKVATSVA